MEIQQAAKTVLTNYANFNDRSARPEFWWWVLAYFVVAVIVTFIGGMLNMSNILSGLLGLAVLVPNIAVGVRRLHDIGKSGWWILIGLIPILGWIAIIYFYVQPSQGPNQFGDGPIPLAAA